MKRNKFLRNTIIVAIAICLVLGIRACNKPETRIFRTVTNHSEELTEIAENTLNGNAEDYNNVKNEGVFESENGYKIVQFYVTGVGIVPASSYYGFYYSPGDQPACYQNMDYPLEQTGPETWEWSDGTDNGGITKRITENWYYYKAWF